MTEKPIIIKILVMDDMPEQLARYTNLILGISNSGRESALKSPIKPLIAVASNGESALNMLLDARERGQPFDVITADVNIDSGRGGIWLLNTLISTYSQEDWDELTFLLVSSSSTLGDIKTELNGLEEAWKGHFKVISSDLDPEIYLHSIWKAVDDSATRLFQRSIRIQTASVTDWNRSLIEICDSLSEIRNIAAGSLAADAPMLIMGESNRERLLFAQWIHYKNSPKSTCFVRVDPDQLNTPGQHHLGTIFGQKYADGSQSISILSETNAGTLFIDSVEKFPSSVIRQFERFLENPTYNLQGSGILSSWQGQLVLGTPVSQGAHNSLVQRIPIRLSIPPLRERKSEIPSLVEAIYRVTPPHESDVGLNSCLKFFKEICNTGYTWPNNLDELEVLVKQIKVEGKFETSDLYAAFERHQSVQAFPYSKVAAMGTYHQRVLHYFIYNYLINCKHNAKIPRNCREISDVNWQSWLFPDAGTATPIIETHMFGRYDRQSRLVVCDLCNDLARELGISPTRGH